MKIIKPGETKLIERKFECNKCGCVFIAEYGEYKAADQMAYMHDGIVAECTCPTCGNKAYCYR